MIAYSCGVRVKWARQPGCHNSSLVAGSMICFAMPSMNVSCAIRIANYLTRRKALEPGSNDFGHAFEHLMIQEIIAFLGYNRCDDHLSYWRTSGGYEVDAIVGDGRVAIEFKSASEVKSRHTHGLKAFAEDYPQARLIIVSLDKYRRLLNGVEVIPAVEFLHDLWSGRIITP